MVRISSFRSSIVAIAILVASLVSPLRSLAESVTTTSEEVSLTTLTPSETSSTFYIGAIFVECAYSVILRDAGAYESIRMRVFWNQYEECGPADSGPAVGATFSPLTYYDPISLTGLPEELPARTELLQCLGIDLISGSDDPTSLDFTRLRVDSIDATDLTGQPTAPPRLCIADLECDGEPYHFSWKSVPPCGDADYNTGVDATDALIALRTSVGLSTCDPVPTSCDTNGNGAVTVVDALAILRVATGAPLELQCPIPCMP
jgi:hypothetical protein